MRRVGAKEIQQKEKINCDQAQLESNRKLEKFKDLLMLRSFRVIKFRECEEALEVAQAVSTLSNQKLGCEDQLTSLRSQTKIDKQPKLFVQNKKQQLNLTSYSNDKIRLLNHNLNATSEKSNRSFNGVCINHKAAQNNSKCYCYENRKNYSVPVHPPESSKKTNYDDQCNGNYSFKKYNRRQFSEPVKSLSKPFQNFDNQEVRFLGSFYDVS